MLETMNDYKKESQKTEEIIEQQQPKETSTELTLADSVYAKLQSGLTVVSNLNLKSGLAALSQEDDESYIPEEDEANQSILESALNSSTRDPMQAHNLDQEEVPTVYSKSISANGSVWSITTPIIAGMDHPS